MVVFWLFRVWSSGAGRGVVSGWNRGELCCRGRGGWHCGRGRVVVGRPLDDVLPTAGDRVDMAIEDGCAFWKGPWVWTL